jgi:hypothetical protein
MRKLFLIFIAIFIGVSCDSGITIKTQHGRYIASEHLSKINGKEKISKGVKELLNEEQNLHNKDLWGANAFSSNINPDYVPENNPKFPLPYYLIPADDVKFLQATSLDEKVASQLTMRISGKKYYKLFVHPESEAHYEFLKHAYRYIGPEETEFMASPTSSYRSLIVWNGEDVAKKPFIAKVSLDKNVIGSIDRLVSENEVERSVANQKVFDHMGKSKLEAMNVKVFPESAGLVVTKELSGAPEKLGGQLIREIPEEVIESKKKWFSFSALMSPNKKPQPLIMDVIKASGLSSYDFFDQIMIKNYLTMFEELSLKSGINFEPHSQNLCFETDLNLKPTGKWVIRDFGGVWPDAVTMAKNKGPVEIYMEAASAKKYKLRGGRSNYISSYVFFYKRQVFDMMLTEVAKYDKSLTSKEIEMLKETIDATFLKQINKYLGLKLKEVPTMSNYKKIEEMVINQSELSSEIAKKPLKKTSELETFIEVKKGNEEWISLAEAKGKTQFFLTDHAVYEVSGDKIVGMGLFNQVELEEYKVNKGHLPRLDSIQISNPSICQQMVQNFFTN